MYKWKARRSYGNELMRNEKEWSNEAKWIYTIEHDRYEFSQNNGTTASFWWSGTHCTATVSNEKGQCYWILNLEPLIVGSKNGDHCSVTVCKRKQSTAHCTTAVCKQEQWSMEPSPLSNEAEPSASHGELRETETTVSSFHIGNTPPDL